jgi:hypothetical protein
MAILGGLGFVGYDFFQCTTKVLQTEELELKEYAEEDSKRLVERCRVVKNYSM